MRVLFVAAVQAELGDLPGRALGVGPIRAALGASSVLAQAPDAVILVGTAGAYPSSDLPIGRAVVGRALGMEQSVAELDQGYVPLAPEPIQTEGEADILTVLAITTGADLAAARGRRWQVEHMETYPMALACQRAGVRFAAVLGISNEVGPDAHAQWSANRAQAEQAARTRARALAQQWRTHGLA